MIATASRANTMAVAYRILPMPVRGEMIPPAKNWENPMRADALPVFSFSVSSANAVAVVKMIPVKKSMMNSVDSMHIRGVLNPIHTAARSAAVMMPFFPIDRAWIVVRNLFAARLPVMMAKAFSPKQAPKESEDSPYIC